MSPTDSTLLLSTGSRWRRDAVEPLLRAYAAEPGVQAVLLSGSVHTLITSTERLLHAVLVQHSPKPDGLNTRQGLVDGIAFHGGDLVEAWKSRVTPYPRELAVPVIESAGVIDHFWRWGMLVERRNPVLLAGMFSAVCEQVLSTLLAINRRYGPKPKWLDSLTNNLDVAPRNLGDRLRGVFSADPASAAVLLTQLVEETFELVEVHLPEVDVERLRRIFRHRRPPLDQLPST